MLKANNISNMADGRLKQEYLDSMGTALLINGLQLCKEFMENQRQQQQKATQT